MTWTIAQVARMTKTTARTLRHYDAVGLLRPAALGPGGMRQYEREHLLRLQRILLLRDLGLGLDAIASVLDEQDRRGTGRVLAQHRLWLLAESERLACLAATVQRTIDELQGGRQMEPAELFEGFDPSGYEAEVNERWPRQAAEARRRTGNWTPADHRDAARQGAAVAVRFAEFNQQGVGAGDPRVQDAVAAHFEEVCRFWTPTADAYRGLGEMYVADERFRGFYDKHGAGTAEYLRDAMAIYARARLE